MMGKVVGVWIHAMDDYTDVKYWVSFKKDMTNYDFDADDVYDSKAEAEEGLKKIKENVQAD